MKRAFLVLFLLGFVVSVAYSYDVALKNGKIVKGSLLSQNSEFFLIIDSDGTQIRIKRTQVDLEKTAKLNDLPASRATISLIIKRTTVDVESIPAGANVFLAKATGEIRLFSAITPMQITGLDPAKYELRLALFGHEDFVTTFSVESAVSPINVRASLIQSKKIRSELVLTSADFPSFTEIDGSRYNFKQIRARELLQSLARESRTILVIPAQFNLETKVSLNIPKTSPELLFSTLVARLGLTYEVHDRAIWIRSNASIPDHLEARAVYAYGSPTSGRSGDQSLSSPPSLPRAVDRPIIRPLIPRYTPQLGGSGCRSGHWISFVSQDGQIIKLEDGSLWRVSAFDALDSSLWLPMDDIVSCADKLINVDQGEIVQAEILEENTFTWIKPQQKIFTIEAATDDSTFVINGDVFTAKLYCFGFDEGDSVIFTEGRPGAICLSAKFVSLVNGKSCEVWCE